MAGDWIKFEATTPDKPEVVRMAAILGIDQDAVVGKLMRLWVWADQNSVDGNGVTVTSAFLDRITFCPNFAFAMREVNWLVGDDGALTLPNFGRHNGKTAKERAVSNRRVTKHRLCNGNETVDVTLAPLQKPLPEKRREEKKEQDQELLCIGVAEAPAKSDPIPFQGIVDLYNSTLTALPKVRELTAKRRTLIRTAWQAAPSRRSLKFWAAYFAECQDDDFQNGAGPYREPHANWRPSFDHLLAEKTVTKVYERAMDKFDREAQTA